MKELKPEGKTWYIAHNAVDVFHYGETDKPQQLVTGQPHLDCFPTKDEYLARLQELGVELEENA